jgi:Xaa-Pro dipeptidase
MLEDVLIKIRSRLEESAFDAILVFGLDNIEYLSGAPLIFPYNYPDKFIAVFWPQGEEPVTIIPVEWESSFVNMSWMTRTRQYTEKPSNISTVVEAVAHLARSTVRKTGTIGIDMNRIQNSLYRTLEGELVDFELASCDEWLKGLRMTKTPSEVNLLQKCAYKTDHAIFGQAHHVLVTRPGSEMSLSEGLRVHALERGLDEVGHHSIAQVASGPNIQKFWPLSPRYGVGLERTPKPNEWVRLELKASLNGYWSDGARMLTMGPPTRDQSESYGNLVGLRKAAMNLIRPGIKANQIHGAMKAEAAERGIELVSDIGTGHGVGVAPREPPYLNSSDETEIERDMILVIAPVIKDKNGALLTSKDTIQVTENGAKIMGWYKDWREPYIANYTL